MKIKVKCEDPHSPQGVFEFEEKIARELAKKPHYSIVNGGTVTMTGKIKIPEKKEVSRGED